MSKVIFVNLPVRPRPSSWFLAGFRCTSTTSVRYAPQARTGAAASPMATGMETGFKPLDELPASKASA
jgi:hypothetical protein